MRSKKSFFFTIDRGLIENFNNRGIWFHRQNLYKSLSQRYKIIGIGRVNKNSKLNSSKNLINNSITYNNLSKINFEPDVIMHCAGSGSVIKSYKNRKKITIKM